MAGPGGAADLRLADLLASISLAGDLGMGLPAEHAIRSCFFATRAARSLGLHEEAVSDVYFSALLQDVGCTGAAHEQAAFAADDMRLRKQTAVRDLGDPRQVMAMMWSLSSALPAGRRPAAIMRMATQGKKAGRVFQRATCEVGAIMADRLGFGGEVQRCLIDLFERWDGKGGPRGKRGEEASLTARIVRASGHAAIAHEALGPQAASGAVAKASGGSLDPEVCRCLLTDMEAASQEIEEGDCWQKVLSSEPEPVRLVSSRRLDDLIRALADLADLKSPFFSGHSQAVGDLCLRASQTLGWEDAAASEVFRAACVHDLGRTGVSNAVWDKPGPLSTSEWEQVRLHPYHTERILSRSRALSPLAAVASMDHERMDGTGYHRAVGGEAIPVAARILASADAYQAMTEARPHRKAHTPEQAAKVLEAEGGAGRLDPSAVAAVLEAAGHKIQMPKPERPGGLSEREVEVLRLIALGLTARDVADELVISRKTASNHIQNIYAKIGVTTRAGATLFAMRHRVVI